MYALVMTKLASSPAQSELLVKQRKLSFKTPTKRRYFKYYFNDKLEPDYLISYDENYNVVFVKWKKFCCKDDYRKPLEYALEVIKKYKCNYVADTRDGFEDNPLDTKWVADYFMPKAAEYGCKCIYFIIDDNNSLKEELEGQEKDSENLIKFRYIYDIKEIADTK